LAKQLSFQKMDHKPGQELVHKLRHSHSDQPATRETVALKRRTFAVRHVPDKHIRADLA